MNGSKIIPLIVGAIAVAIGAVGVLAGLGFLPKGRSDPTIPMAEQQAVAIGIGVVFAAGGASAMLSALPGGAARIAKTMLGFVVAIGLTALFGWVAIGSGSRGFSSPLAILGPHVNDIAGRIVFGFGAIMGLLLTVRMFRGVGRAARPPGD
jgi:hypothetical protein